MRFVSVSAALVTAALTPACAVSKFVLASWRAAPALWVASMALPDRFQVGFDVHGTGSFGGGSGGPQDIGNHDKT